MGFSEFIRRTTEGPSVSPQNYNYGTVSLVSLSSLSKLCASIRGGEFPSFLSIREQGLLLRGFIWDTTPQGSDYWDEIESGERQLTEEDRDWILGLGEYHGIQ